MTKIPEISLKNSKKNKTTISKEIYNACINVGFFSIIDHGLNIDLVKKVLKLSSDFFDQPDKIKKKYHLKNGYGQRGYTPLGIETAKKFKIPDRKEFWHHGRSTWDSKYKNNMPSNLIINEVKTINQELINLFNEFEKIGSEILSYIAITLDLKDDWFDDKINQGNSILRLIHYPKTEKRSTGLRAEAHEDINLITLLIGTNQAGLEVLDHKKNWIPIDVGYDKIVCNVGDMLQRLTNNRFKSTTHRVRNPKRIEENKSRYSIPYFLHFNPDFIIKTLPNCTSKKEPNLYPHPITANEFLISRLKEINLR